MIFFRVESVDVRRKKILLYEYTGCTDKVVQGG